MNLTHLPGCTKENSRNRLLNACMSIRDDQLDPGESSLLEILE